MQAKATGAWAERPLDAATLGQVLERIGNRPEAPRAEVVETGIKIVDLLAPFPRGGNVAILGPMGVGKTVLIQEIIHNLRSRDEEVSLFTFVKPGAEVALFKEVADEAARLSLSLAQMVILASDDPRDLGPLAETFDALIHMSIDRAVNQLWPAVDPGRSESRLLTPEVVGDEHYSVATAVRKHLARFKALEQEIRDGNVYQLSAEDRQVLGRGRRLERFFTQSFFVAEEWTRRPGTYVSTADTIRGCAAILAGECDALPESAFLHGGTIEDARAKATRGAA
jgi:F0F1-type ATP synthase beta subunit